MPRRRQPAPAPVYFLDENMGRQIVAQRLRDAGHRVEVHADHFAPGTPDIDWLAAVGQKGWVVLGKDVAIGRNALERETLLESGVRAFLLTRQGLTGQETADLLLRVMAAIERRVARSRRAFICSISRGGTVKLVAERG